jgi:hypothetical protein
MPVSKSKIAATFSTEQQNMLFTKYNISPPLLLVKCRCKNSVNLVGGTGWEQPLLSRNDTSATQIDALEIRWPNGNSEIIKGVAVDKIVKIKEGVGLEK